MTFDDTLQRFSALETERQVGCLVRFGHNLTIAARDTYEFQSAEVRFPQRLREINEIQHRVFGHILALLRGSERYPDDVLLSIFFKHDDEYFRGQTLWAFRNALKEYCSPQGQP